MSRRSRASYETTEWLQDKPAPTTGINPERSGEQIDSPCPVHAAGGCEVETLGYDDRDDSYLQRCMHTGQTWWVRKIGGEER